MATRLKIEIILRTGNYKDSEISLKNSRGKEIGRGSWWLKSKEFHVTDFRINKYYRRKGYGNFLARVIIDTAKFLKADVISLTDGASVKGFWQKLGWVSNRNYNKYTGTEVLKLREYGPHT